MSLISQSPCFNLSIPFNHFEFIFRHIKYSFWWFCFKMYISYLSMLLIFLLKGFSSFFVYCFVFFPSGSLLFLFPIDKRKWWLQIYVVLNFNLKLRLLLVIMVWVVDWFLSMNQSKLQIGLSCCWWCRLAVFAVGMYPG